MPQIVCPWCNQITNKIDNQFRFVCCEKAFHLCPLHNKGKLINGKKYIIGGPGPNECLFCKAYDLQNIKSKEPKMEIIQSEDDERIPRNMLNLCSTRPGLKKILLNKYK